VSQVNVLTVEWRSRPRRASRVAAEFFIDGRPLLEYCERATGETFDLLSPFGWTAPGHQLAVAERLLLLRPPLLPSGRREFLVCAECGEDLGCGCISANIESEDGCYIWSDFGYENDYDPGSLRLFRMGKFVFPEGEVVRLLGGIVRGLSDRAG
jgi:hypothetical protein